MRRAYGPLYCAKHLASPPAGQAPPDLKLLRPLSHRPKGVRTEIGCNRFMEQKWHDKFVEYFKKPRQSVPMKKVMHNLRYFMKPGKLVGAPTQDFSKIGVKILDLSKGYQDLTKGVFKDDTELVIRITIYHDKTVDWKIEPPPPQWYILRAARKKRRETGVGPKIPAYLTLEMLYEVAKARQRFWGELEYPPIETRVRKLADMARRMGIAIIGVDGPPSPVRGMTAAEYEKECAILRKIQYDQWLDWKAKETTERAPLLEQIHHLDLKKLSYEKLEEGVKDPTLLDALWKATQPRSRYLKDLKERELAMKELRNRNWVNKDMPWEEVRSLYLNWKLPTKERAAALHGIGGGDPEANIHWTPTRDNLKQ